MLEVVMLGTRTIKRKPLDQSEDHNFPFTDDDFYTMANEVVLRVRRQLSRAPLREIGPEGIGYWVERVF